MVKPFFPYRQLSLYSQRPDAEIRSYWEFIYVPRNYLQISTISELLLIFPELAEIINNASNCNDSLVPFILAQLALQKNDDRWQLFALRALFEMMGEESLARE